MNMLSPRLRIVIKLIGIIFSIATIVLFLSTTGDSAISTRNILPRETIGNISQVTPTPIPFKSHPDQKILAANHQVIELQNELKKRGYYLGALDGIYGEQTQEAVYNFQISTGLEETGIVDEKTWQSLQPNYRQEVNETPPMGLKLSPDLQTIVDRGELRVALLGIDAPPFFIKNKSGDLIGLDLEIAQGLATALGVSLKIDRTAKTFNDVVNIVNAKKADLGISKLSQTLTRAKSVLFSHPYLTLRHGLLINRLQLAKAAKEKDIVEFLKNFEGKIGVIKGSSYVGFTQDKFPRAEVIEFTTWEDVIAAAMDGDVLAAYRDELEVKKIVVNQPNIALNFKTVALTDSQDPIAIALPWSSSHLLEFVNLYLNLKGINYTVDTLIQRYSDILAKPNPPKQP